MGRGEGEGRERKEGEGEKVKGEEERKRRGRVYIGKCHFQCRKPWYTLANKHTKM